MKTLIVFVLMAIVTIALLLPMILTVANTTLYRLEYSHDNVNTAFAKHSNYNAYRDIAPRRGGDGIVNLSDFGLIGLHWRQ